MISSEKRDRISRSSSFFHAKSVTIFPNPLSPKIEIFRKTANSSNYTASQHTISCRSCACCTNVNTLTHITHTKQPENECIFFVCFPLRNSAMHILALTFCDAFTQLFRVSFRRVTYCRALVKKGDFLLLLYTAVKSHILFIMSQFRCIP